MSSRRVFVFMQLIFMVAWVISSSQAHAEMSAYLTWEKQLESKILDNLSQSSVAPAYTKLSCTISDKTISVDGKEYSGHIEIAAKDSLGGSCSWIVVIEPHTAGSDYFVPIISYRPDASGGCQNSDANTIRTYGIEEWKSEIAKHFAPMSSNPNNIQRAMVVYGQRLNDHGVNENYVMMVMGFVEVFKASP